MIIHVVQPGDTIYSISGTYNITVDKLIKDNGLEDIPQLVIGQTLVIVYPAISYTVQEGDTLEYIANNFEVSIIQLLRNNPYLADREYIYPGEVIAIKYNRIGTIITNGFVYPFIDLNILRKTLPFLTYLTIFNYRATPEGYIISLDDEKIINLAKSYGVAPIMLLSPLSTLSGDNYSISYNILYNEEIQDRLIYNVLNTMKAKGYYGLNIYIENVHPEVIESIEIYLKKFTTILNNEGYPVTITLTPTTFDSQDNFVNGKINYTNIANTVDNILLLSYAWGYSYGPPGAVTPVNKIIETINKIIPQIPAPKLNIGITAIGYDWQLPYIEGVSRASALSSNAVLQLAAAENATIMFDEVSLAPYFYYSDNNQNNTPNHIVWFKDARSINELLNIKTEYDVYGISIWNVMEFNTQMWLLINVHYDILTAL